MLNGYNVESYSPLIKCVFFWFWNVSLTFCFKFSIVIYVTKESLPHHWRFLLVLMQLGVFEDMVYCLCNERATTAQNDRKKKFFQCPFHLLIYFGPECCAEHSGNFWFLILVVVFCKYMKMFANNTFTRHFHCNNSWHKMF